MNTFLKRTKVIFALLGVTLLAGITACDMTEPDLPFDLEGSLNNNGAYLRVLAQAPFDIAQGADAEYVLTFEYYDGREVSLLDNVTFYASYASFALDPTQIERVAETTDPFLTVPASAFTTNDDGNLQATVVIPITDVVNVLGLDMADVEVEDSFGIRWQVNTTDGRSFSTNDRSSAVSGGYYNSPYFSNVGVVQEVPADMFVGEYQFTQRDPGLVLPNLFAGTFTATLSVDPANPLNGRVFTAAPYQDWGVLSPVTVRISLGQTAGINGPSVGTGLGCGVGLRFGPASGGLELIDINDDSEFTLVISENTEGDCSVGSFNVYLDAVKL